MTDAAIYFVTGSSGSGKTTLLKRIAEQLPNNIVVHHFDEEGVHDLDFWFDRVNSQKNKLHVLDGSIRPSDILDKSQKYTFSSVKIVLIDCGHDERKHRLVNLRKQPELDTLDMYAWAAYLRGQADILKLDIIDTADVSVEDSALELKNNIESYFKLFVT